MSDLGSWLATYAVHSTLMLAIGLAATRFIGNPLAARRLLIVAILAAPITTSLALSVVVGPRSGVGVETPTPIASRAPEPLAGGGSHSVTAVPAEDPVSSTGPSRSPRSPSGLRIEVPLPGGFALLAGIWLVVALLGVAHLGVTTLHSVRSIRRSSRPFPEELDPELTRYVKAEHPGIRLATTGAFIAPMAIPPSTIVIPAWAACELSASELRAIFDHERAHLTHRDPVWRTLLVLLARIFFFQPLLRAAVRRFDALSEWSADGLAAQSSDAKRALARAIVFVADRVEGGHQAACAAGLVRPPENAIGTRIRRLVGAPTPSRPLPAFLAVAWLVAIAAGTTALSVADRPDHLAEPPVTSAMATEGSAELDGAGGSTKDASGDGEWIAWSTESASWSVRSSTRELRHVHPASFETSDRLWILARSDEAGRIDAVWMSTQGPPVLPRNRDTGSRDIESRDLEGQYLTNATSLARLEALRGRSTNVAVASELGAAVAVHADWALVRAAAWTLLATPVRVPQAAEAEEMIQWLARRPPATTEEDEQVTDLLRHVALRPGGGPEALEAIDGLGQRALHYAGAHEALTSIVATGAHPAIVDEAAEWLVRNQAR